MGSTHRKPRFSLNFALYMTRFEHGLLTLF
jgi:hypothetical protein